MRFHNTFSCYLIRISQHSYETLCAILVQTKISVAFSTRRPDSRILTTRLRSIQRPVKPQQRGRQRACVSPMVAPREWAAYQ